MGVGDILYRRWTFLTDIWGRTGAALFCAAVVATHLVAAWFNAGFLSADEHYQIIEFAQYKLGRQSAAALAWEFPEHMRPALQPWLAALTIRLHHLAGLPSPFAIAFTLRLISTALATFVTLEVCLRLVRPVSSRTLRQAALFLAFFLWIAPLSHGRFSSENWGGMWLALGLCFALDAADAAPVDRRACIMRAAFAGAAWALAFYFRFQIAVAIASAFFWLAAVRRAPTVLLVSIVAAFAVVCALNVVADHWLYGAWTLTPLNYLRVNLIEGRSAAYGVSPWWLILLYLFVALVPPFSLAFIIVLLAGSWYARQEVVVWTAAPFVAIHVLIAHKEPRFVMPLLYLIGPWFAICAESLPPHVWRVLSKWRTSLVAGAAAFCVIDLLALAVTVLLPVNDRISFDQWLWDQKSRGLAVVYATAPRKTAVPVNVTNSFYESGVRFEPFDAGLRSTRSSAPAFIYYPGSVPPREVARMGCRTVFTTYPAWLGESNLFRRMADVETDSVCRVDVRR